MPSTRSRSGAPRRSRGRPRLEDAADIESELLDIALQEFLQQGYGGASISQVVKKAGISKSTIYSRFASKEDLFRAIMEKQIERLQPEKLLDFGGSKLDLERGLKNYANHMLELSLKEELLGVNRLMYSESHRFPELGEAAAERTRLGIKRISDFIRDCAASDGVPCKHPENVAEAFILMIRGWYINVMLTNQEVTPEAQRHWVDGVVRVLLVSREEW